MSFKSMTAFGSAEHSTDSTQYRCEIRTLNSRFADISLKLPRGLIALEPQLLQLVKGRLARGKIDVFLELSPLDKAAHLPRLNEAAVQHYLHISEELNRIAPSLGRLSQYELIRLDGVIETTGGLSGEAFIAAHEPHIKAVVEAALKQVIKNREIEGAVLADALDKLVAAISEDREAILSKREQVQAHMRETYKKRLERILGQVAGAIPDLKTFLPEERMFGELAVLGDRTDIEEELTRLKAHEDEFLRIMQNEEEAGRKLDFLCQEMHREVNTISSKLTQLDISGHSLALKQTVERLRQQVQNIE